MDNTEEYKKQYDDFMKSYEFSKKNLKDKIDELQSISDEIIGMKRLEVLDTYILIESWLEEVKILMKSRMDKLENENIIT